MIYTDIVTADVESIHHCVKVIVFHKQVGAALLAFCTDQSERATVMNYK